MSSIIIARLLGPLMLISAAAILLNRKGIQEAVSDTAKSPGLIYVSGVLTLVAGLAIVQFHNVFKGGPETLITVLGYLMLVGGAARMLVPDQLAAAGRRMVRQRGMLEVSAVISAVVGIVLMVKAL
jgi:hypothetical protein